MWIIIRLLLGIAILAAVEVYFFRKTNNAVKTLFPLFHQKSFGVIKKASLIWINLYPLILIYVFVKFAITKEYVSSPDSALFDYLFVYPFWLAFILMLQTAIYFLIIDLFKIFLFPFYKKGKEKFLSYQSVAVFILVAGFIIYIPLRVIFDYNTISVRTVEYEKQNLPAALDNFKIVFISDIQADHYTDDARLEKFISKVNEQNPDLILIGGDFITTGPKYINKSAEYVGKLKAKHGIYSTIGDHDNWAYRNDYKRSIHEITSALKEKNIDVVDNAQRVITVDGARIGITVVTNTYVSKVPEKLLDSLSSYNHNDFKIFLTHQPRERMIAAAKRNGFDLYLAGHTHGGQISLVFPFLQLTPTMIETKYIKGDFRFGNLLLVVTRGLGMSLAPVRYNSTPEITVIILKNHKQQISNNK